MTIKTSPYLATTFLALTALVLASWGPKGHRAVAQIAQNHLSPAAKSAVKNILGTEDLVDVSNFADDIRTDPQYKYTGAWHYVNVEPGLTFGQFVKAVTTMPQENVYKMVIKFERVLKDPGKPVTERATALKYIVHLIGDLHQPMHVSNGADKGGNDIPVKFDGYNDNLHGLWDSGLIDHQGLTYKQMAVAYDNATPVEIKRWQSDDLMVWLWESYQISTILYQEAAKAPNFDDNYYKTHLPVLEKRIEKAGIRLAGVLNGIFDKPASK
jgi:S1/P1 Nuclease